MLYTKGIRIEVTVMGNVCEEAHPLDDFNTGHLYGKRVSFSVYFDSELKKKFQVLCKLRRKYFNDVVGTLVEEALKTDLTGVAYDQKKSNLSKTTSRLESSTHQKLQDTCLRLNIFKSEFLEYLIDKELK